MKKRAVEFTAGLAAASIPDAIKATIAEKLAAYQSDFFAWMDGAVTVANTQEATSDVYSAIEPRIDAFLKSVEQVSAAATASNDAARAATNMQMEIAILLMIVAVSAFGFLIGRSVSGPLTTITTALAELANGNKSVEILFTDRSDEIGDNARAAKNFRDNLVRMEKLEAQQKEGEVRAATERKTAEEREAAERRAAAEQEEAAQKAAMHKLANEFEAAVGSIIETVSSASIELEAAADTLTKIAHTTQRLSTVVASASDEASTNVQSVASATEEGASSLQEISRQLQESSKVANDAAKQAARTDADVSKLSNAAQRIGDVVKLIATVAEQTNLLALNATIEAARAGEAGKGFAVVAQEVKALAAMTAKAAEEIRAQITGIQVATQESVTAITEIGGTIGWISEIATATVARMEKQGTATREIVRNVREAAKCTAQVAVNITDVNRGAIETGSASARLLSSAQVLANESNRLKAEVGKFLNTVRAA
jgi:methyl-accepting chemotaxis protein